METWNTILPFYRSSRSFNEHHLNVRNTEASELGCEHASKSLLFRVPHCRVDHSAMIACQGERNVLLLGNFLISYLIGNSRPVERNKKKTRKWSTRSEEREALGESKEIRIEMHLMADVCYGQWYVCHVSVGQAWKVFLSSRSILQHPPSDRLSQKVAR